MIDCTKQSLTEMRVDSGPALCFGEGPHLRYLLAPGNYHVAATCRDRFNLRACRRPIYNQVDSVD